MLGRRKSNSGKGFSSFLTTVVLALLTVVASQAYPRYQRNQSYVAALNKVRTDFSSQRWEAAINGYHELWDQYPDKGKADQFNLAAAHENWGAELYEGSLRTRQKFGAAANQFEKAAAHRDLSEESLMALGDCYVETKQFEKVKSVLTEARKRDDVNEDRFNVLSKRLDKAISAGK